MGEPMEVNGGQQKQDVEVGDVKATGRVTVWEEIRYGAPSVS